MLESVISALLFFQVLVAVVGALIGYLARGAIVSAHNALQHLYAISQASAALCVAPSEGRVIVPISQGQERIFPSPTINVPLGSRLLVYHPANENEITTNEEIVVVTSTDSDSFTANFAQNHAPGARVRPLGSALLPKIVCGGDKGFHTHSAPSYYLNLPFLVMIIWAFLFVITLALLVITLAFRSWFFSLLGVK
jgi:hypothetical protein